MMYRFPRPLLLCCTVLTLGVLPVAAAVAQTTTTAPKGKTKKAAPTTVVAAPGSAAASAATTTAVAAAGAAGAPATSTTPVDDDVLPAVDCSIRPRALAALEKQRARLQAKWNALEARQRQATAAGRVAAAAALQDQLDEYAERLSELQAVIDQYKVRCAA